MSDPNDRRSRHARAPLLESILAFLDREQASFFTPGHKLGRSLDPELRSRLAEADICNLPDTDTLHCPTGPILEAERLLADAYGTAASYILVGGSTAGNIASLLATCRPGDRVVVQRNSHKSVIAGLVHSGVHPIWVLPDYDPYFGIAHGLPISRIEAAFAREPSTRALLILNPTYYGVTPDIAEIARLCRERGKALLVDEAHGSHFHFSDELPMAAEDVGADVVVQSTHKVLSALSQGAVLHTNGSRLDATAMRRVLQLIQTTSPSFATMASIDTARRQMVLDGAAMLRATLQRARAAREAMARIPGIEVMGRTHLPGPGGGAVDLDETKIVLRVDRLRMTGHDFQRALNAEHGVQPELAGAGHVLLACTVGNCEADFDRLVSAVATVARTGRASLRPGIPDALRRAPLAAELPPADLSPREAFYAPSAPEPLEAAEGRISADVVTPYPPGIPVLVPGERVTRDVLAGLRAVRDAGLPVSASDPSLATLRVIS